MYTNGTFKSNNVHDMYMRRPSIPDSLYETVQDHAREHDNSWYQALERVLEQKANLEIKETAEATA